MAELVNYFRGVNYIIVPVSDKVSDVRIIIGDRD